MSLNFYQGTTTRRTLQVSQSLFDLAVAEVTVRNKFPIQNLLKKYHATRLSLSLGLLCTFDGEQSVSCFTGQDKLDGQCCSLIFISSEIVT